MNYWHQIPIVRLIVPFLTGILLAIYFEKPVGFIYFMIFVLVIIYVVFVATYARRLNFRNRWVVGVLQNAILLLAGYSLVILNTSRFNTENISQIQEPEIMLVQVIEQVSEKENSFKIITKVLAFKDSTEWKKASGKLLFYFEKDNLCASIEYGDNLMVRARLNEIESARNPGEFNYKRYLNNKGIYNQAYVNSGNWEVLSRGHGNVIKKGGIGIRDKLLSVLNENGLAGKEYAVVSAVLLGYDDFLDAEQKQQFAAAGAMHILCVSGLHVGIIYYVLNLMLSFLKRKRIWRLLKIMLILIFIWMYASITGFSPSVLRASTMFSFVAIGLSMKRRVNIFNMLAASAFLLLAINPYFITEVGFQLSYIAVAGILLIYKPIYNLFVARFWIVDKVWQISVVSIAATIATFPLSIFYFHQFPRLFLLTNLVAIPSSMLIIYLGIIVLVFSPVPVISIFLGKILSSVIWFLNFTVGWIEGLPYSAATGLFVTRSELLLIYGAIIAIIAIAMLKRKFYIWTSMLFFILLFSSFLIRQHGLHSNSGIILYSIRNASAIDFINKGDVVFVADSMVISNPDKFRYQIENSRIQARAKEIAAFQIDVSSIDLQWFQKDGNYICFGNKTFVIVDKDFKVFPDSDKFRIDFIVYTQNAPITVAKLCDSFNFELLIIGPSNSFWKAEKIKEECAQLGIDYYCVQERGAWVYNLTGN